jgi:hypothetical protein
MSNPVDLTLFMPALNEELSIRRTVVAAHEAVESGQLVGNLVVRLPAAQEV